MSQTDEESKLPELPYVDQLRLKAFLRDAEALIAAERGLNPTSRRKLEALAQQRSLSEPLKRLAFQRLQARQDHDKPTRYEQAFAEFLQQEFRQLSGNVLSYRAEQKAIRLAQSRYQLSSRRAEQIISQQAQLAAVERLAQSDAAAYASQFLHEQIGRQEALSDELLASLKERLVALGMPVEEVDSSIAYQLFFNRENRLRASRNRQLKRIGMVLGLILIPLVAVVVYRLISHDRRSPPQAAARPVDDRAVIDESKSAGDKPNQPIPAESPSVANRQFGEHVLQQVLNTGDLSATDFRTLQDRFLSEADDGLAFQLIEPFLQALTPAKDAIPNLQPMQRRYAANRLLAELIIGNPSGKVAEKWNSRLAQLRKLVSANTGTAVEDRTLEQYLTESEKRLAIEQWEQLIEHHWTQPFEVTANLKPLIELTESRLPAETLNPLIARTLRLTLEAHPRFWKEFEPELHQIVTQSDSTEASQWLELARQTSDSGLRDALGKILINRSFKPIRIDEDLNLRQALELLHNARGRQLDRTVQFDRIDRVVERLLDNMINIRRPLNANDVQTIARLVNLELAAQSYGSSAGSSEFDNTPSLNQEFAELEVFLTRSFEDKDDRGLVWPSSRPQPTVSERKRFETALEALGNLAPSAVKNRLRAMDELAELADSIGDLSYEQAQVVAGYLFQATDPDEELNLQRQLPALRPWLTLGLAVADRIEVDTALNHRSAMVVRLFFQVDCDAGQTNLQPQLISALKRQVDRLSDRSPTSWTRLKSALETIYRERLQRLGHANIPDNADSLLDVLIDAVEAAERIRPSTDEGLLEPERLRNFLANEPLSEIEQIQLVSRTLLDTQRQNFVKLKRVDQDDVPDRSLEQRKQQIALLKKTWSRPSLGQALWLTEWEWLEFSLRRRASRIAQDSKTVPRASEENEEREQ